MIVWSLCTFPEHHIFQGLNIKQGTSAIQSASSRALWSFASFQQKSKSKPLRNYPEWDWEMNALRFCTFLVLSWKGKRDGKTHSRQHHLTATRSFWRKQPGMWHQVPIKGQWSGSRFVSLETSHPGRSLRVKKKQPAIQILKRTKNQKGEEPGYFLVIFGSLHQLNSEIFYIGMLDSEVFPYNFGVYISISDRNYFQPSPYSFVISLAHLWFIPQPQLSIYN